MAALNAAKITQCNNENSSKILESLYSNQSEWVKGKSNEDVNENLKKFLASEGFEINFTKCTSDKSIEDYVLNDRIEGAKNFKVNATPTIIINDEKFEKSLKLQKFKKIIRKTDISFAMEFKKIQLNGFKSFADKTNFLIEDGLTGIVGPNGCGKSNIVESLRWVMGETSAKSMRGSGMEDVIFSGTSNKASKNIAEVSISVSNQNNEGPVHYREI